MPKHFAAIQPKRLLHHALTDLRSQIKRILEYVGQTDPVSNPILLRHLTSYASIVAGQPLQCQWGDSHYTDLIGTIVLNPYDPKDAPAPDRKIVVDAALEHEVRGHWLHTPRSVFEAVCAMADGTGREAQTPYWQHTERANKRHAIRPLFNILEDGRIETRLRWEQPEAYKIIAAGDRIRPRWTVPSFYLPVQKAYSRLLNQTTNRLETVCIICHKNRSLQDIPCLSCFTEQYRWEQISGILLLAALPPHAPPIAVVEPEVQIVFQACVPWLLRVLGGTSQQTFEAAQGVLKILIENGMASSISKLNHLIVSDAVGSPHTQDSRITTSAAQASKLTQENLSENESASQQFEQVVVSDLRDFDFVADLDLEVVRAKAKADIDAIETEKQIEAARTLILSASGLEAGYGVSVDIQRTPLRSDIYAHLKRINMERGQRFAREIQALISAIARPEQFQRRGHLDRSQLVNATARGRQTVFSKTRMRQQLSLAISLLVDVSGSMVSYNRPDILTTHLSYKSHEVAQLADALTICALGLERPGIAFEVRAFGSHQWLAKGFYDHRSDGIGGIPGLDNGGTDMMPAIMYSRLALLGREESNQIIVVMTDGYPVNPERVTEQIRLARLQGIHVLGLLFANESEERIKTDAAMAKLFGPDGYTVIHALDQFPREVGRTIKGLIRQQAVLTNK